MDTPTIITARVNHFHDFYYLMAIEADLMTAKSANPENEFRHSFVKLETDVQAYKAKFVELFAENIVNYIWAACLGEARHASDKCNGKGEVLQELDGLGRDTVYSKAHLYPVNEENLNTAIRIYSQDWDSNYGGEAWLQIAEAVQMYYNGTLDAVSFIDHVADLQHNGGSVFSKCAEAYTGFDTENSDEIKDFLDYKFHYDILRNHQVNVSVSSKIKSLVERHNNIIEGKIVTHWLHIGSEPVQKSWVEYGEKTLETDELQAQYCDYNEHFTSDSVREINSELVCRNCQNNHFTYCGCGHYEHDSNVQHLDGYSICESCFDDSSWAMCEDCGDCFTEYVELDGKCYCENCKDANLGYCEEHDEYYERGDECSRCED